MGYRETKTSTPTPGRLALAATAALALTLAATGALAQMGAGPMGGGPGMQGMQGLQGAPAMPAGPGMHGGGGPGADGMLPRILAHAKASLGLTPAQQALWDAAVATSKADHDKIVANRQTVHDVLIAELANTPPNLRNVATAADAVQQTNLPLQKEIREAWLKVYESLSGSQQAIVRDLMQKRLARLEAWRERMHNRLDQQFGG